MVERLAKVKKDPQERKEPAGISEPPQRKKGRRELIEERNLTLLFKDPENLKKLKEEDIQQMSIKTQEIVYGLKKAESLEFSALKKVFPEATLKEVKHIAVLADLEEDEEGLQDEFHLCLKSLVIFSLKERLEEIIKEIRKAEGSNESLKLDLLLKEFHEITKELSS